MDRILLLLGHKENRRLLERWLGRNYQIVPADAARIPDEPFDLGILDGPALDRLGEQVQARKQAEGPTFLPFLLITSRQDVKMVTRHLWRTVDELILTPIEQIELQARVEILLRARQFSLESERRYHALSESSLAGVVIVGQEGRILYANDTFSKICGYTREELLSLSPQAVQAMVHPDDQARVWGPFQDHLAGKAISPRYEYRGIRKDGGVRWLEMHVGPIDYRGQPVIQGIVVDVTERVRAQEALARREEELRATLYSIGDAVISTDVEGRVARMNPVAERLTGWTEAEAAGKSLDEVFHIVNEESRRPVESPVARVLREGVVVGLANHTLLIARDGAEYPIADAGAPIHDRQGNIAGVVLVFRDQTAERIAQRAVEEARQFAESIVATVREPLVVLDPDLRVVSANRAFYQTFQAKPEETEGQLLYELGNRQWDIPELRRLLEEILPQNTFFDDYEVTHDFPHLGQRTMLLNARRIYREEEKTRIILLAMEDITERVRAQEEQERLTAQVSAQARQVQGILDTVPQGVLLLDGEGRILHANPVAERDLSVLVGAQVGDVLTHLGDRPLAELLTSPPIKGLWHEVKADGRTFEVITRPVEQGPALEQWVLVINDVTREREVQAQLQRQERLAAVGQLAGGIAHDFNNIMAVIILYAGTVARSEGLTERDREKIAIINQQGWHATRLVEQILDFSRQAVLEQRPLDLLPLLKEQVKLLERTLPEHIEITLAHREEEYVVSADLTRMRQMVMNLALNARDAMPQGGTLRIGLEKIEVEHGKSPLLPEMEAGEWVRLTVSDTGTGIAPDVLPHIFDPFFTTKAPGEGTGLGLAQVDGIVGQHGGRIGVTTEEGKGTTFTIYLPALAAHPVEPPAPDVSTMPQGRGEVMLVVEDGEAVRAALVKSLEQMNYQALEAANGEEALAVMEEHGEQVALVLSDVVMPVMGGVRLLHALRQQGWETPVILLTGHTVGQDLDELRAQGLSAWLPKPPSLEQLSQTIARALSG